MNQFRKSFKIPLTFFLSVRLKLILPSQINSFLFLNIVYFERTVMLVVEDYFNNQDLNCKVLNKYPTRQELEILVLELKLSKTN